MLCATAFYVLATIHWIEILSAVYHYLVDNVFRSLSNQGPEISWFSSNIN